MNPSTSELTWRFLIHQQLKVLLDASPSYNFKEAQEYLAFTDKYIVGALGPQPSSPVAGWKSYITDDHSPIEYSLSIKKNACVVRFAFEPLSSESGIVDPVNYLAPTQWLSRFLNEGDGDLEWFHKLSEQLIISSGNHSPIDHPACGLTQYAFGLDLMKTPLFKAYIFFDALVRQSFSPPSEWGEQKHRALTDALTSIGLENPWKKVLSYLDNLSRTSPEYSGKAEFISWDVVKPESARAKIYVRFAKADLSHLLAHIDLGGMLQNKKHTRQIQAAASQLWNIFARDSDDNYVASDFEGRSTRTQGVILYYELRLGSEEPVAKFYFPIRYNFISDQQIAERFDDFLSSRKISEPGWYRSLLSSYCSHRSLNSRTGIQTLVGCAVRGGEWEVSVYLSSEAYAPERWMCPG